MNQRGMTLIEIMIAIGILSVVMLAYTQMNTQTMKGVSNGRMGNDFNNLVTTLSSALQNTAVCNSNLGAPGNFATTSFNTTLPTASIGVNQLTLVGGSSLVQAGQQYSPGLTITGLQINNFQLLSGGTYQANLNIQATKTGGTFVGSPTLTANIPLTFQTTPGAPPMATLQSCGATGSRTCNANGCYRIEPDGTIEQWGSLVCPAPSCFVTFPYSFTTTTNLSVTATINAGPGMGNVTTVVGGITVLGFDVGNNGVVNVGGSGLAYVGGGTDYWHAIGN